MVTVGEDAAAVEVLLGSGRLACPVCAGRLTAWGWGRSRQVRARQESVRLRPRRTRCSGCGRTHVLLPDTALLRRADLVAVIGAGLELAAAGWGHRRIAAVLGRPVSTVRGWLRRLRGKSELVAGVFTRWLVRLADDPARVLPVAATTGLGDAVAAVIGFARAARSRFAMFTAPTWTLASSASRGRLLAAGWPAPVG